VGLKGKGEESVAILSGTKSPELQMPNSAFPECCSALIALCKEGGGMGGPCFTANHTARLLYLSLAVCKN
jgi:hypothetical protein